MKLQGHAPLKVRLRNIVPAHSPRLPPIHCLCPLLPTGATIPVVLVLPHLWCHFHGAHVIHPPRSLRSMQPIMHSIELRSPDLFPPLHSLLGACIGHSWTSPRPHRRLLCPPPSNPSAIFWIRPSALVMILDISVLSLALTSRQSGPCQVCTHQSPLMY
jgi:hypothetical protein